MRSDLNRSGSRYLLSSNAIFFPYISVTAVEIAWNKEHHTRSSGPVADSIWLIECQNISHPILYFPLIILGESSCGISNIEWSLVVVRDSVSSAHRSYKIPI